MDEKSYDITLGLARGYYMQDKFGTAFQKIVAVKTFAKTDEQKALAFYWSALIQEKRDHRGEAVKDWKDLLAMNKNALTDEMRQTAEEHLKFIVTPTYTPRGGKKTATPTATLKPRTPTPTSKAGTTVTPTSKVNATVTLTRKVTVTATPTLKVTVTVTPTPK